MEAAQNVPPVNDISVDKRKIVYQQLVLLLHAHKCQRRDQTQQAQPCTLPHCSTMKNVLNHMAICHEMNACKVTHCLSSRQIISHWKNCSSNDCGLCSPLKAAFHVKEQKKKENPSCKALAPVEEVLTAEQHDILNNYLTHHKVNSSQTGVVKEWHKTVSKDFRDHLVHKLVKAIFPSDSLTHLADERMKHIVEYANKVETEKFEAADTKEEYYQQLAEKVFMIQKELTEKRRQLADKQEFDKLMGDLSITPTNYHFWEALMPTLDKLYMQNPESYPFREPIDPQLLNIPNYSDIIKNPMDLSTIDRKLANGEYQTPWQYIDDVWLMFDNAWLYNSQDSKVFKYATKLAEIFEQEVSPIMQSLGYCCGRKYPFYPQVLNCSNNQLCKIPRDTKYWNYDNRYIFCKKCFTLVPDFVKDPGPPLKIIKKYEFISVLNVAIDLEGFVDCSECVKKMHKACVKSLDANRFICNHCCRGRV